MKLYLSKERIKQAQNKAHNNESLPELCKNAGVRYNSLKVALKMQYTTPKIAYLIADYIDCPMQDLYEIDWSEG